MHLYQTSSFCVKKGCGDEAGRCRFRGGGSALPVNVSKEPAISDYISNLNTPSSSQMPRSSQWRWRGEEEEDQLTKISKILHIVQCNYAQHNLTSSAAEASCIPIIDSSMVVEHNNEILALGGPNTLVPAAPWPGDANLSSMVRSSESRHVINVPCKKKPNLTDDERHAVYKYLLGKVNGPDQSKKLMKGALKEAAVRFGVTATSISTIWKRGRKSLAEGAVSARVSSLKVGRTGPKSKEVDVNKLKSTPLRQRKTVRSLAVAMEMSRSTIHRRIKEGKIKSHSNAIKPFLTDFNKVERVKFCLSKLNPSRLLTFYDGMDLVHIDEKWFYITEATTKFYLAPDEEPPHRTVKSKSFVTKVMFMAAVARPRYDSFRQQNFDGKIGIFSFVYQEPAKRSSKNRPRGTLETKCIESVNKSAVKSMIIDKVLPAIRERWPRSWRGKTNNTIIIQQDNAKPHLSGVEEDFTNAARQDGFDIRLMSQPPNSPDMNVLDLGLFRAIQSLQHHLMQSNIDGLITATEKAFWLMEPDKLNNIFLTWQQCMIEVMTIDSGNNYKLPHIGKTALQRKGQLPDCLQCLEAIFKRAQSLIIGGV